MEALADEVVSEDLPAVEGLEDLLRVTLVEEVEEEDSRVRTGLTRGTDRGGVEG